jgi:hypothetical protein
MPSPQLSFSGEFNSLLSFSAYRFYLGDPSIQVRDETPRRTTPSKNRGGRFFVVLLAAFYDLGVITFCAFRYPSSIFLCYFALLLLSTYIYFYSILLLTPTFTAPPSRSCATLSIGEFFLVLQVFPIRFHFVFIIRVVSSPSPPFFTYLLLRVHLFYYSALLFIIVLLSSIYGIY